MTLLFLIIGLIWFVLGLACLDGLRHLPDLPRRRPRGRPRVTALVAARDEADRIETTIRQLLAQRGVDLDVVVVDDRSTDATGSITERLAAEQPRVTAIRVDHLPPGWLGKCHALHVASRHARGDRVLLTDADTWLDPDVVQHACAEADDCEVPHLCLVPHMAETGRSGRVIALTMNLALLVRGARVNLGKESLGIGAFQLIDADVYREVGGHEALRLEVVEDLALGERLRRHGYASRVRYGLDRVEVVWVTGLTSFFRLLEKNYFALVRYDLRLLALAIGVPLALWTLAVASPWLADPGPATFAVTGLWSLALPAALTAVRYRWSPWLALWIPMTIPVVVAALLYSATLTLVRGGVRWRDTFHPLAELRAVVSRKS